MPDFFFNWMNYCIYWSVDSCVQNAGLLLGCLVALISHMSLLVLVKIYQYRRIPASINNLHDCVYCLYCAALEVFSDTILHLSSYILQGQCAQIH